MTNNEITFQVEAYENWIYASAQVADETAARAAAATFAKSAKVNGTTLHGIKTPNGQRTTCGLVRFQVRLVADGVTGTANETGTRRYRSFRRTCGQLGYAVEFAIRGQNALDEAGLENRIAR